MKVHLKNWIIFCLQTINQITANDDSPELKLVVEENCG